MTDQLISFETAKLAKEKGFNSCSDVRYAYFGTLNHIERIPENSGIHYGAYAPTQSLLQKWLRDKHKIQVWVTYHYPINGKYMFVLMFKNGVGVQDTYEEALEQGLKEALLLIK